MPLAFIFALVGVMFVSYAFMQLTREFSHAGSVYAFSGFTLGPHAGFFAGWALLGHLHGVHDARRPPRSGCSSRLPRLTASPTAPTGSWIALVAGAIIAFLACGDIRVATRSLLSIEGISVA